MLMGPLTSVWEYSPTLPKNRNEDFCGGAPSFVKIAARRVGNRVLTKRHRLISRPWFLVSWGLVGCHSMGAPHTTWEDDHRDGFAPRPSHPNPLRPRRAQGPRREPLGLGPHADPSASPSEALNTIPARTWDLSARPAPPETRTARATRKAQCPTRLPTYPRGLRGKPACTHMAQRSSQKPRDPEACGTAPSPLRACTAPQTTRATAATDQKPRAVPAVATRAGREVGSPARKAGPRPPNSTWRPDGPLRRSAPGPPSKPNSNSPSAPSEPPQPASRGAPRNSTAAWRAICNTTVNSNRPRPPKEASSLSGPYPPW